MLKTCYVYVNILYVAYVFRSKVCQQLHNVWLLNACKVNEVVFNCFVPLTKLKNLVVGLSMQ